MSLASKKSLVYQVHSGKIDTDKLFILNLIMKNDSSISDIEEKSLIRYSTITARLSDLMDLGLIYIKRLDKNKRYSIYSFQSCTIKQFLSVKKRKQEKYEAWKLRYEDFKDVIERDFIEKIMLDFNN